MLELHQLDWQLQLTGAVSDMHSSKAANSAVCAVYSETHHYWLVLQCWDFAMAGIADGDKLSTSHTALPAMGHDCERLRNSLYSCLVRGCPTFQYQRQTVRCCSLYLILNVKYAPEQTSTARLFPCSLACHFQRLYSFLHGISATVEQLDKTTLTSCRKHSNTHTLTWLACLLLGLWRCCSDLLPADPMAA